MFGHGGTAGAPLTGGIESWEIPIGRDLVPHLDLGEMLSLPYQPHALQDIPVDAVEALTELAGIAAPTDVLVCPPTTRTTEQGAVYLPEQVLGIGACGIALWVADLPFDRVVAVLPYREIAMIEHRIVREYARLTVLGTRHRLTLRYRAAAWPTINDLLTRVRARVVAQPAPPTLDSATLSVSWEHLARSALVTLGDPTPATVVSVDAHRVRGWRRRVWPAVTAALTHQELVVLGDATGRLPLAHGVHLFAVPRADVTAVRDCGTGLEITTAGLTHRIDLGPTAVTAIMTGLAPHLFPAVRRHHPHAVQSTPTAATDAGRPR